MENDLVKERGGQQDSTASPPQETFNGINQTVSESHKATKPPMENRNHLHYDYEEEDVCRICRIPGNEEAPLYCPCACSGSIKYVHEACLLKWLNHKEKEDRNTWQCEICNLSFVFSPVYAENTPKLLPVQEFLSDIALKAASCLSFLMRLLFVSSVWVLFIPFTTIWMWRLTFVRSFSEGLDLFPNGCTSRRIYLDWCLGYCLSGAISFVEYWWHLWWQSQGGEQAENGAERRFARIPTFQLGHGAALWGAAPDLQEPLWQPGEINMELHPGQGEAQVPPQGMRRNAVDDDAPLEPRIAQILRYQWRMNFPLFHLIKSTTMMLTTNAIALALVGLVPFTLGRLALSISSWIFNMAAIGLIQCIATSSSIENTLMRHLSASISGSHVIIMEAVNISGDGNAAEGAPSSHTRSAMQNAIGERMAIALEHSNFAAVAVGYGAILLSLSIYLGFIPLIRYSPREPDVVMTGVKNLVVVVKVAVLTGVKYLTAVVQEALITGLKYLATMGTVAFAVLIKLGVVFLVCGWWLDICTLGMRDVSITQQVEFFWASPLTSSLLHWLVGILHMLHISIFVGFLRKVLRPGLLSFFPDPTDPDNNLFQNLTEGRIHNHAWCVQFSIVAHCFFIVMAVFVPVQLAVLTAPSIFPLDIRVSDPLHGFPEDPVLYISYGVVIFIQFGAMIQTAISHWFSGVSWALGLHEFILPDRNCPQAAIYQHREGGEEEELLMGTALEQESTESDADGGKSAVEFQFFLRIAMLSSAAWITILAFNWAVIVVSVTVGNWMSSLLHTKLDASNNDIYGNRVDRSLLWYIIMGYVVLKSTTTAVRYVMGYLRTHGALAVCKQVLEWSAIVAKISLLLALGLGVLPILAGLLHELTATVAFFLPTDESPVSVFYLDWTSRWTMGLDLVLLIWLGQLLMYLYPLQDENWRILFEPALADGFANLPDWVLKEMMTPMLTRLLMALCVPYAFSRWIFPSLGCSVIVNSLVYRFAWLGSLGIVMLWYGGKGMWQWVSHLHESIRDNRYLVGRRLCNFENR